MYRVPRGGTFQYKCGLYMQSQGKLCAHNTLAGPAAVQFVLGCIRQRALAPELPNRIRDRVRELADAELGVDSRAAERTASEKELRKVVHQLQVAARNMTLAESEDELRDMRAVCNDLRATKHQLEERLRQASVAGPVPGGIEAQVDQAMTGLDRLAALAGGVGDPAAVSELFNPLDVKVYARFTAASRAAGS